MTLKSTIETIKNRLKSIHILNNVKLEDLLILLKLLEMMRAGEFKQHDLLVATDLLREIESDELNHPRYINGVYDFETNNEEINIIITLLELFKNIVHENLGHDEEKNNVTAEEIITQLTNINKLSKYNHDNILSIIQSHLTLCTDEIFNPAFIPARGFAQEGEDLVLQRLVPANQKGFYVDIGAHHPTRFSNTYKFYKIGWRGINIDPMPGVMQLFNKVRPNDINLELTIGSGDMSSQEANYIRFAEPAYNSIYFEDISEVKNTIYSEIIDIIKVKIQSLDGVLEQYSDAFNQINLLSIDVEGFEMEVLKGFSIKKYMPDTIIIEIRGFDIDTKNQYEEYNLIVENGYKLRSVMLHSLIFQKITD